MKRRNRHERILELLQTSELDIDRLAEMLEVSIATIRRGILGDSLNKEKSPGPTEGLCSFRPVSSDPYKNGR